MDDYQELNGKVIYSDNEHQFVWLGADPHEKEGIIQTNQYLIVNNGRGILLDPGGVHLFARVVSATSRYLPLASIDTIIFSHQDPDVSSGIALWMGVTNAKIYISKLWIRFLPHFGIVDTKRIIPIEETENKVRVSNDHYLRFIPAHFLHSTGNYSVYDEGSKILFTADIGAAVFEKGKQYLSVENFENHLPLMEPFHKRYMASNKVCRKWVDKVSSLEIHTIAPQHGALFQGKNVQKFLDWFKNLSCGIDELEKHYRE